MEASKQKYQERFIFMCTRNRKQFKKQVQLDLFIPYEYGYDFKIIVSNKRINARKVLGYRNSRGAQILTFWLVYTS